MRAVIAALACAGCYRPSIRNCQYSCATGSACPEGFVCDQGMCVGAIGEACAPNPDGAPGELIGEAGCAWSYPVSNVNPCQFAGITGDWIVLTSNTTTIDTNAATITGDAPPAGSIHVVTQAAGVEAMVVYVGQFDLGRDAIFIVSGSRPLIILADDRAGIDGEIVFSGESSCLTSGAGTMGGVATTTTTVGGGGGGGSLGIVTIFSNGAGADGGSGFNGATSGAAGDPIADTSLVPLVMGCPGGAGGDTGGAGGLGGGAIQISTRTTLDILGTLNANATGGRSVSAGGGGGGGGGSGGAILLEAMMTTLQTTSTLCANGGGGGGTGTSMPGENGSCSLAVAHGAGAPGGPGSGGDGETANSSAVVGQLGAGSTGGGGGGGGGGVGIVHVNGNVSVAGIQTPHIH